MPKNKRRKSLSSGRARSVRKVKRNDKRSFYVFLSLVAVGAFVLALIIRKQNNIMPGFIALGEPIESILAINGSSDATASATPTYDYIPPSAATNLKVIVSYPATRKESYTITLTWDAATDNVGVVAYHIYRNDTFITTVTTTSYIDTTASTTLSRYFVRAKDLRGNLSDPSNTAAVTGIDGGVYNKANLQSIQSAKVEAVGNGIQQTVYTNYLGFYLLNLSPGTYTVTYTKRGFTPQTWQLMVVTNTVIDKNVYLTK